LGFNVFLGFRFSAIRQPPKTERLNPINKFDPILKKLSGLSTQAWALMYLVLGFRFGTQIIQGGCMASDSNIQSYRDLHVWQKAMDLVVECYKLTEKLPPAEIYGLTSSIRRSCILVPANIADGKGRDSVGEYLQKISAASGSLKLLETHLLVADRLKYLPMSEIEPSLDLCDQIGKMLTRLAQSLRGGRG
jgi:four helix bundle protein